MSICTSALLEEFQFPGEKNKNGIPIQFIMYKRAINKDLVNDFIPYLIGIIICLYSKLFNYLNKKFTKYENHILEIEFKLSYLIKNIVFNSINYYSFLFYLIFFKVYKNKCPKNDCYNYLSDQLCKIFIGIILVRIFDVFYE